MFVEKLVICEKRFFLKPIFQYLSFHSPYFAFLFNSDEMDKGTNEIELKEVSSKVMKSNLQFDDLRLLRTWKSCSI